MSIVELADPLLSLVLSTVMVAPFVVGVALGLHGLLLPGRRPHFHDWYRRRTPRRQWSEANYLRFNRIVGGWLLGLSLLYGCGVVFLFRSLL